jgi:hypothetical protein
MAVGIFEFYPAVRYFRLVIPEDVYVGKACNCQCIAASRPWYSTFNYWYWLCIVIVPLLIFSIPPNASKLQKLTIVFISAGLCYLFMNLAVHLFWDIRNGPFIWMDIGKFVCRVLLRYQADNTSLFEKTQSLIILPHQQFPLLWLTSARQYRRPCHLLQYKDRLCPKMTFRFFDFP